MAIEKISNQEVIPDIESQIFDGHETSQLAVGVVGIGNEAMPGLENEFEGYKLLRGNVYAKQKEYMSVDELNSDGTETDADDARSVHFAVIENAARNPRVVGAMRLIIKARQGETSLPRDVIAEAPLPIEEHYPEAFVEESAPMPSTESSRLIARHEERRRQRAIKWMLFTAGVSYIATKKLGSAYGAVEPALSRGLRIEGMPLTELGEAKFVEEFNASKLPIRIDVPELARRIEEGQPGALDEARAHDFVYSGSVAQEPVVAA